MRNVDTIQLEKLGVEMKDGATNAVIVFRPKNAATNAPLVVIFPALGVQGKYYHSFASHWANQGAIVATTDWRGHGESSIRPSKTVDFGFKELLLDYKKTFDAIRKRYPLQPLYVLGHSLGGQLASMFLSTHQYGQKGLILVASGSPYYKGWKGLERWGVWGGVRLARTIANTMGYYPGKTFGFGGTEAKGVIRDWSLVAQTGLYRAEGDTTNYEEKLSQLAVPVLALSFEGDKMSIPQSNKNLYQKFKNTEGQVTHTHLAKSDPLNDSFNHFSWAKKPENIIKIIENWISDS